MSSPESTDSENPQSRTPPPSPSKDRPKKKKKPVPPQETINKIWSRFSAQKFSKATVILPFAPVPTRASFDPAKPLPDLKPKQDNLLVSEDYDRAVQECRARVQKLIKECRRVNMRYRDADFDIDWDLKWGKGYCLNGLGEARFEFTDRAMINPTSDVPKSVKRVHEIFNKPTFLKDKPSPADVKQGNLGDCWLMASLTALANMEGGIQRICVEYDTKIGIYGFVFHRDGEWIISIIDDKLYLKSPNWDSPSVLRHLLEQIDREDVEVEYRKTYQTGSQSLFFAQCKDQNETWLPLLEKAYAKAHGDYSSLAGGWIGEGVEDLTGGVTTELLTSDILDTDEFWNNEILKVNKEFLFGCATGILDGGYGNRGGISEGHAYVLMEAREISTGQRLVKLRNPWGKGKKGNWEGAWSDGSKEFTPEIQQELNHKFGNDSVFWISYDDLLRKYQHFDRTRLFMDNPDWRITQKWISVDVPWKAEFEQKFRIVLKKESPVVLVLSQLDDRYFEGLQGQYTFRLQFRLHEVDSLGENDYIVRSHGNYLMDRSVATELKTLPAGTYSVFIMVIANRDTRAPSVEEVVESECKRRADNEKLAQVGMKYDLAHRKGALYIQGKIAAQKLKDKAKAREARIATRRKLWEKRQLSREILRKQENKNKEKRELKEAKDAAAAKEREEKAPKDQSVQTEEVNVQFGSEEKGIQTEDRNASSAESEKTVLPASEAQSSELDKGVQTDDNSTTASQCTPDTPKGSSRANSPPNLSRQSSMPHERPHSPPPYPRERDHRGREHKDYADRRNYSRSHPQQYITSEGESSASPIPDFDDMYSDDDPTLKPRSSQTTGAKPPGSKKRCDDSDDEDKPDPWNAVCLVGLRIYSQDEALELSIYEEAEDDATEVKIMENEEEGTDADVEDAGDEETKQEPKKDEENKNIEETPLPIRVKEEDELVLADEEKKALALGAEAEAMKADEGKNSKVALGIKTLAEKEEEYRARIQALEAELKLSRAKAKHQKPDAEARVVDVANTVIDAPFKLHEALVVDETMDLAVKAEADAIDPQTLDGEGTVQGGPVVVIAGDNVL